ncbi:MAG: Hpt domain-containing protein [Pseudomonadota bacterium]
MLGWLKGRPRAPARPILDSEFLARLEGHIGADVVQELLSDGLIEIEDRLQALERAAARHDRGEALRLAHDITGIAGHLGLSALSLASASLVREGREAPDHATPALVAPVLALGPDALAALRRRVEAGVPA